MDEEAEPFVCDASHSCGYIHFSHEDWAKDSSLCVPGMKDWSKEDYRKFLHENLDKFLDADDEFGFFVVGIVNPPY